MILNKISHITGTIQLITGLHIGAGKDSIEIGGLDLPIMKNPLTKAPYIPGSSIKGKMRSLLENYLTFKGGEKKPDIQSGTPCACCECIICKVFGAHASGDKKEKLGPTRLLVRDAMLTEDFQVKLENGSLPMEIKYENTIDRVKGTANNPRPVERVPAGVEFSFEIVLKEYENDAREDLENLLKNGLKLIELDALGGHSSRGSGQVKFKNLKKDDTSFELPEKLL